MRNIPAPFLPWRAGFVGRDILGREIAPLGSSELAGLEPLPDLISPAERRELGARAASAAVAGYELGRALRAALLRPAAPAMPAQHDPAAFRAVLRRRFG